VGFPKGTFGVQFFWTFGLSTVEPRSFQDAEVAPAIRQYVNKWNEQRLAITVNMVAAEVAAQTDICSDRYLYRTPVNEPIAPVAGVPVHYRQEATLMD
jgi:hypothetical protein